MLATELKNLTKQIQEIKLLHPLRIGIDGFSASGKTTIADELAKLLRESGRDVIRSGVDGFHNPRSIRHQRGRDSIEGYYEDSFNYSAMKEYILNPLGPDGDLKYRVAHFDFRIDSEVISPIEKAKPDSILIFEGVFLFRPELLNSWDLKIFVDADIETILQRACTRDAELFGSPEEVIKIYNNRYIPGQKMYFAQVYPKDIADIIFDNNSI